MTTDFWLVLAFAVPAVFLAGNLSLLWHEVVGHGCVALALGGEFHGITVSFGNGWSRSWPKHDAKPWEHAAQLGGGIVLTTLFGVGCIVLAASLPNSPVLRFFLTVAGASAILDSGPYLFWNSVRPVPPGDVGRIFEIWRNNWRGARVFRWCCVCIGGTMAFAGLAVFLWILFAQIQALAFGSEPLVGTARLTAIGAFTLIAILPWLPTDWDEVIPGIGRQPTVWGVLCTIATGMAMHRWMPITAAQDLTGAVTPVVVVWFWMVGLVYAAAIAVKLRHGVHWTKYCNSTPMVRFVNVLMLQALRDDRSTLRVTLGHEGIRLFMDSDECAPPPSYLFPPMVERLLFMAGIKKTPDSLDSLDAVFMVKAEGQVSHWAISSDDLGREIVLTRRDA